MTKQEILRRAVALVSAYPQTPVIGGGQTSFTSSAEVYYDLVLAPAMESYVYGFGIASFALTNPQLNTRDPAYKIFNIP